MVRKMFFKCARTLHQYLDAKKCSSLFFKIAFSLYSVATLKEISYSRSMPNLSMMRQWKVGGKGKGGGELRKSSRLMNDIWLQFQPNAFQITTWFQFEKCCNSYFTLKCFCCIFSSYMIYDIYDSTWVSKKVMLFEWMDRNPVRVRSPVCSTTFIPLTHGNKWASE